MKMKLSGIIAAVALTFSMPAQAMVCSGQITRLGSGNTLNIDIGYGMWAICSLEGSLGGVVPQSCTAWYAMLTSAKLTDRVVAMYFDPGNAYNDGITTCEGLGNWLVRVPYFIEYYPGTPLKSQDMPLPSQIKGGDPR